MRLFRWDEEAVEGCCMRITLKPQVQSDRCIMTPEVLFLTYDEAMLFKELSLKERIMI
jgi:hypothetical protein